MRLLLRLLQAKTMFSSGSDCKAEEEEAIKYAARKLLSQNIEEKNQRMLLNYSN